MKMWKKALSFLLALAMLAGFVPAVDLTAFAAEPTEIKELSFSFRNQDDIPVVGGIIKHCSAGAIKTNDDRINLTGSSLYWNIDDSSICVNDTFNDYGMYFEAGRSYNTDLSFEVLEPNKYSVTENTVFTFANPGDFTYTAKLDRITDTGSGIFAHIKLTITMNGQRIYPDISKVVFKDFVSPSDGVSTTACGADIYYNNCQITNTNWLGDTWGENIFGNRTFVAGNTYTYRIQLTARDGYKFDGNTTVILTNVGTTKEPAAYTYSNGNKVLTLDYTYFIQDITWLNSMDAYLRDPYATVTPIAGKNAITLGAAPHYAFHADEAAPYTIVKNLWDPWYDENGKELNHTNTFEVGKTYYFEIAYSIKDEYVHLYRFHPDSLTTTIIGEAFSGNGFQKAERVEYDTHDNTYVKFRYYFTAQFANNAGQTANNPAVCHTYNEFKYAMENEDIRYVALGNVEDLLPAIPHDEEKEPDGITRTAIVVRGHKDLNLLGNAVFRCPLTGNYDLKYYIQLLTLTDAANSSLYIHGNGSLTYEGGTLYFVNSAITVDGGHLTVDGATVRGSNGYHTGYCYGINARRGSVSIQNGATVIGEVYGGDDGICAMAIGEEGETRSLSVSIFDGKFYVERDTGDGDLDHGITVWNDCGLRIYGMTSDGIQLGRHAADTLDDYVMEGCAMTVGGVKTDPATRGTTDGYVEVYKEISEVEIYVETPVAGESATVYPEEVYWVPEGCTVDSIVWYKNGEALNPAYAPRFEAGSSYRVEVTLVADNGVRFANPLTGAEISYKTATVNAHGGNAQKGIVMSVDFGACPNIVPEVDLTVTAPKEGQKPSYTVGCGSDAYYAAGNNQNYTEYRQWYESSDGEVWWKINPGSKFTADYYYKLVVDIQTKNGYEFPLIDHGTIQPNVSATVNGYYANVMKAYEQDPSRYITVEYNFGECSDSIVEKITVENVIAPVAGEKPNYNYSIRGGGYQMNTAKNAYEDIYWKNPPEQWYFIKNGIGWYDLTKNDWVYEHETFIAGHEYQVRVYVRTEDGFEFAHTRDYQPTVTATVNGKTAAPITTGSDCAWNQQVQYTFTCKKQDVSTVMINGLDAPQRDAIPDREVSAAYPDLYTVEFINWYDCEDNPLYGEDTFRAGERYKVEIKIVPKQLGGVNASQFVSPVKGYINGQEVTERLGWDAVYASANAVYIYYTFMAPAGAPQNQSYTVSGEVVSYDGDPSGTVIQLLPYGTTEVAYETVLSANGTYSVQNVQEGIYLIYFSKSGYITREFIINVAGNVVQDCVMMREPAYLKGDVDNDSDVDLDDAIYLLYYVNFKETYPVNQPVDFNGDSKEDLDDAIYLLYHVNFKDTYPLH